MHIQSVVRLAQLHLLLLLSATSAEPIHSPGGFFDDADLIPRAAAPNWTTQAWQTHCNNIDYFGDNNDCCIHVSGGAWKNCNGVGTSTSSSSGVLCYDLTTGHDCCADGSVCDTNLPCSGGTCSQTKDSVTVCEDGCVSYDGRGCKGGTCLYGVDVGSGTTTAPSGAASATKTGSAPGQTGTALTGADLGGGGGGGGLSTSDKIAIGIGVPVGIFTILGAIIAWLMCCR